MTAAPKVSLRERARREKFQRIRFATEKLLEDHTLDEITMREVAHLAEVGEATLFRYVNAKEELLQLVFGQKLEDIVMRLENDPAYSGDRHRDADELLATIDDLYTIRIQLFLNDPKNVADFVRIGLEPESPLSTSSISLGDRYIQLLESIIQRGQNDGVVRKEWDAYIIADNCHSLYIHEVIRAASRKIPLETFSERLLKRIHTQLDPLLIR